MLVGEAVIPAAGSKREQFADDPVNLFAVEARVNRQKGAKGPLEWMPPRESFHCQYVTRFKRVLITYGLELGATERERFEDELVARSFSFRVAPSGLSCQNS